MQFEVFGFAVEPWLFAVCTAGLLCWEVGRIWLALASELWPSVTGAVREARVDSRRDSDGDEYFIPYVRYTYTVRGENYDGKRLAFHPRGVSTYAAATRLLRGVSANKQHRVYYHRKHPWLSVLKPGASKWNYILLLVLFAMTVAAMYVQDQAA